jgi:hypothetical protein
MPACPTHNTPARAVSQTLRSLTNETQRKPIRTISIAAGTAGKGFTRLLGTLNKPDELAGGCRSSLPRLANSALTGSITLLIVLGIAVWVSAGDKFAAKMISWLITVGDALATEAANNKNTMHNGLQNRKKLLSPLKLITDNSYIKHTLQQMDLNQQSA